MWRGEWSGSKNVKVAGVTGLEPATFGVTGRRSNQLSYTPADRLLPGTPAFAGLRQGPRQVNSAGRAPVLHVEPRRDDRPRRRMVGGERLELPTSTV